MKNMTRVSVKAEKAVSPQTNSDIAPFCEAYGLNVIVFRSVFFFSWPVVIADMFFIIFDSMRINPDMDAISRKDKLGLKVKKKTPLSRR